MDKPTLQNKVFTENPLLDEIVYNARQLAVGTVLKNPDDADKYETTESLRNSDIYIACLQGSSKFEYFVYTKDMLMLIGMSEEDAQYYAKNNSEIPAEVRPTLCSMATKLFVDNFVEKNNYYRMLHGEPSYDPYGMWEGLYIDTNYIDSMNPTPIERVSASYIEYYDDNLGKMSNYALIHQLSAARIETLRDNGTLDNIVDNYESITSYDPDNVTFSREDFMYLKYTGGRSIDYYTARTADRFAMLYCPFCSSDEVMKRYKELFEANRLYFLYTAYSEAYKYRSEYYDNFVMVFLIIQTVIDMIIELPEYIIRRDIFDTRTCKYIFESNGVKYFSDIPLKYQIALVKNLNKIIKFKSTDKCIIDIASLFGKSNTQIFKYYVLRDRNLDGTNYVDKETVKYDSEGNSYIVEDTDANYDLKFLKVPLLDPYDKYIKSDTNIYTYDSMVDGDPYWNGDMDYESVKSKIKASEFNILKSKYYSVEAVVDLTKRNFTLIYFMNMLMDNDIDKSNLLVSIPSISTTKKFQLVDIILALFALGYIYYGVEDTIMDSRLKIAKILGFNLEADLGTIADYIYQNHAIIFNEIYDPQIPIDRDRILNYFGIANFVIPKDGEILSFAELENIYFTNRDVYDHVKKQLIETTNREVYEIYKYIYNSLFLMDANMRYFLIGDKSYIEELEKAGFKTKFIYIPKRTDYPTEESYIEEYNFFMSTLNHETLYFVLDQNFSENHKYNVYVLNNEGTELEPLKKYICPHCGREITEFSAVCPYCKKVVTEPATEDVDVTMAYTYTEFLRKEDGSIYEYLRQIQEVKAEQTREEICVNAIQNIVSNLKDYITQVNVAEPDNIIDLDYALSTLPSISLDFIRNYVLEVVDYFKSFKIFTHGSSIIYVFDDKYENYVKITEHTLFKYLLDKADMVKIGDKFEGKMERVLDLLVKKGHGIQNYLTKESGIEWLDKIWMEIDTLAQLKLKDLYNSMDLTFVGAVEAAPDEDDQEAIIRFLNEKGHKPSVNDVITVISYVTEADYVYRTRKGPMSHGELVWDKRTERGKHFIGRAQAFEDEDPIAAIDRYLASIKYGGLVRGDVVSVETQSKSTEYMYNGNGWILNGDPEVTRIIRDELAIKAITHGIDDAMEIFDDIPEWFSHHYLDYQVLLPESISENVQMNPGEAVSLQDSFDRIYTKDTVPHKFE